METTIKIEGLDKVLKMHDPRVLDLAVRQTLNKVTKQARTAATKEIRKTYNISAKRLKTIKFRLATMADLTGRIVATGKRPGLQHASATEVRRMHGVNVALGVSKHGGLTGKKGRKLTSGVRVKIRKDRGFKVIKTAFLTMAKGSVGVYRRKFVGRGKQGKKLLRLTMPSPVHMFGREDTQEAIKKVVKEKSGKLFDDALKHFVGKTK